MSATESADPMCPTFARFDWARTMRRMAVPVRATAELGLVRPRDLTARNLHRDLEKKNPNNFKVVPTFKEDKTAG